MIWAQELCGFYLIFYLRSQELKYLNVAWQLFDRNWNVNFPFYRTRAHFWSVKNGSRPVVIICEKEM
jgi:hypothetical protein